MAFAPRFARRSHRTWLQIACACSLTILCLTPVTWLLQRNRNTTAETGNCAETIERLMKAAGWPGWDTPYLMQLTEPTERRAASEACLPKRPTAGVYFDPIGDHCFAEKLSAADRQKSMRHLATVVKELERAGIEYYLDMGTALGALRHFEMIPYDEDIDIRINADQKEVARTLLSRLRFRWPGLLFQDTEWRNQHWKVHFTDTMDPMLQQHVALDIFFYGVNRTRDRLVIREPPFEFPLEDIFPLRQRPFHNRWYPTPNSIGGMISGYFPNTSLADCVYYLHDLPFNQCDQPVMPCQRIKGRFPFAETLQLPAGQLQFLVDYRLPEPAGGGRGVITTLAFIAGANRL